MGYHSMTYKSVHAKQKKKKKEAKSNRNGTFIAFFTFTLKPSTLIKKKISSSLRTGPIGFRSLASIIWKKKPYQIECHSYYFNQLIF